MQLARVQIRFRTRAELAALDPERGFQRFKEPRRGTDGPCAWGTDGTCARGTNSDAGCLPNAWRGSGGALTVCAGVLKSDLRPESHLPLLKVGSERNPWSL